ncbi:MAG: AMP-binding protein [Desulfobulbaceae bacterium]|nr:AMP-binding protein [Desulfobulbaceae bacterium]
MEPIQQTLGQTIGEIAKNFPNNDAIVHSETGVRFNYGLLWWEVERAARGFMKLGVRKGSRVALWGPNISEWIISMLALARIGAIFVPIDQDVDQAQLKVVLGQPECEAIVLTAGLEADEYLGAVMEVRDELACLKNLVLISDKSFNGAIPWSDLTAMGEGIHREDFVGAEGMVKPEDPVAIMYTSGTTGNPKGVVVTHAGLLNKCLSSTRRQGMTDQDRLCLFFPLFHMFGNTCIALSGLLRGASIVMPCKTFEPWRILRAIYEEKCTAVYGSPSMLTGLLDHPDFRQKRWNTVKRGVVGGAPCPEKLMRRLVEEIGISGLTVGYGITETSSWVTMTDPDDPIALRVGTIGRALSCNEVKVVDTKTGEDLSAGQQGELCTRGFLMMEYYKMPGATAAAIDKEGWFHTGDMGVSDEKGYFRITGRLKDAVIRDGVEIYPVEVEEILYRHPGISEVQVFGFEHRKRGQELAAWVRVEKGADLSPISLAAFARDHIPNASLPHFFKIVTQFPMTKSGKVQKFRMGEMAVAEYAADLS